MSIEPVCLLFFVKSPGLTPVKSRLAQAIGAERAGALYRNFVLDMLDTLGGITKEAGYAIRICFTPPEAVEEMRDWLGNTYFYMPQQGENLGERMKNAFAATFCEGYTRVLLLGSDSPDLPGSFIKEGMQRLLHHGAVIGPSFDGGYYLIGFRAEAFLPAIFQGIAWSTETVFHDTMKIFCSAGKHVAVLPPWQDVDTLDDLWMLQERGRTGRLSPSRTLHYLLSVTRDNAQDTSRSR